MKTQLTLGVIAACAITITILGVQDAEAAAYLKFDGVDGESKDKSHESWSNIMSFSQSISRDTSATSGSARARSSAVFHDFVVEKTLDKSSPKLAEAIAKGQVFPKVEIHLAAGQTTYLKYELQNVMITSYSVSGDADERPTEQISFNFAQIKMSYAERGSDGSAKGNVEYSWKIEEGTS